MSPSTPTERPDDPLPEPLPEMLWLTAAVLVLVLAGGVLFLVLAPWVRPIAPLRVQVTETGAGRHLHARADVRMPHSSPSKGVAVIHVDSAVRRQQIDGFGSAMTDSSAYLIWDELPKATRKRVMSALFAADGIHLTSVRIPIGASDFTATGVPYTYDEMPAGESDPEVANFHISHDNAYILPLLREADAINDGLGFIATPWSVPAWMKANDKLSNKSNRGWLKPADYHAYAEYIAAFLFHYEEAGISVGEITPANEPTNATSYPGMNISASAMNTLVSEDLVPYLRERGLSTEVFGADLGWKDAAYAKALVTGAAAKDLSGIAWHCYYGSPTVMSAIEALDPKLGVQMTECSPGISTVSESEVVIESLRNDASVVDLWNIALDERGGPVQPPNRGCPNCYGLVRVDTATHTASYTDAYYDLGQASKYIEPGAQRVKSNTFVRYRYTGPGKDYVSPAIDDVAVRNPDGEIVLLVYNNAKRRETFQVQWRGYSFRYTLAPGATATYRWRGTS